MADEKRKFWEDFFDQCDCNRDGSMTIQELKDKLVGCGRKVTDADVAKMFADIDTDGNKLITKREFMKEMMKKDATEAKEDYKKCFKTWDKNGDGTLGRDELKAAVQKLGHFTDEEIDEMIAEADKNGDGKIDYNEFTKIMCIEQS